MSAQLSQKLTEALLKATVAAFNGGFSQCNTKTQLDSEQQSKLVLFFPFPKGVREVLTNMVLLHDSPAPSVQNSIFKTNFNHFPPQGTGL